VWKSGGKQTLASVFDQFRLFYVDIRKKKKLKSVFLCKILLLRVKTGKLKSLNKKEEREKRVRFGNETII
jgi:hypothetical protein